MDAWSEIRRFFAQVGVTLLAVVIVSVYPVYTYWGRSMLEAAALGCAIATVNVLIGGASAFWAFDKPQNVFLKTLLGGMALRMIAICVVFVLVTKLTALPVVGLGLSLFLFYIIYQALEIRFLTGRGSGRARGV